MSFPQNWETAYANKTQQSIWPWTRLVSFVHQFCDVRRPMDVLELGCGVGANIPFFKSIAANYYAIEGSATAVKDVHKRFPDLAKTVSLADFTQPFPFDKKFDLIFDRASLPHNSAKDIRKCLSLVEESLKPGGVFIGINWFSTSNTYSTRGVPYQNELQTRTGFKEGPYQGIEPMHFFDATELKDLFSSFRLLVLEEENSRQVYPDSQSQLSSWHFAVKKD